MSKDFSILIGGEAGQGSRMAGLIIAKFLINWAIEFIFMRIINH